MGKLKEMNQWPIYDLVDYSDHGELVEFCRSQLRAARPAEDQHLRIIDQTETTTSGYQSQAQESAELKWVQKSEREELIWWQLIGCWSEKSESERNHLSAYGDEICLISSNLAERVR